MRQSSNVNKIKNIRIGNVQISNDASRGGGKLLKPSECRHMGEGWPNCHLDCKNAV